MSVQNLQLRAKAAELFQLDAAAELNFGIYRILNAHRVEIERFLDGLQSEDEAIITSMLTDKSSAAQAEAEKLKTQLEGAAVDPEQSPNYLRLKEAAAGAGSRNTYAIPYEGEEVKLHWANADQDYSTRDLEYALTYVNGDHHLENLRRDDQTWKARLIDEEFPRLMWEGCD